MQGEAPGGESRENDLKKVLMEVCVSHPIHHYYHHHHHVEPVSSLFLIYMYSISYFDTNIIIRRKCAFV